MTTVGIYYGGRSHEHIVSVETANALIPLLRQPGHDIAWIYVSEQGRLLVGDTAAVDARIDSATPVERLHELPEYHMMLSAGRMRLVPVHGGHPDIDIDIVLPLFHGAIGEDGSIQGLCRFFGVACAGPTLLGAALSLDKVICKTIAAQHAIPIGPYTVVQTADPDLDALTAILNGPYVIKPRSQGSSLGVSFAADRHELERAIAEARRFGPDCLVEQYVQAMEVHCYVLKTGTRTRVSLVSGKIPPDRIYSYPDKVRTPHGVRRLAGDDFAPDLVHRIQQSALRIVGLLDGHGLARLDFFLTDAGDLLFNEINSIPGLRRNAAYGSFNSWANHGLEFADIITELIDDQLAPRPAAPA
ncbi:MULTISPECIES: ATP-grasp domain-containing protein [unclassified Nocardia]|uniref:D-alanine--D-alanine ligase family protein n=1 Tax=unclassified Nocardia TaxID=2637762 RepID=UPI001CE434BA|nr:MULTISPECIES: ATP-grasp domain-containing protein [unclassified Nocardia]